MGKTRQDAAAIKCDVCHVLIDFIWEKLGTDRDSKPIEAFQDVVDDLCGEGEKKMPAFMKGHTVVKKVDGKLGFIRTERVDDSYVADRIDEEYGIKVAKRSCIDATDLMDMDF